MTNRIDPSRAGGLLWLAAGLALTALPAAAATPGVYYESFGNELFAGSLANPSLGVGVHIGAATNISVGANGVYWQDGVNIFRSSFDLSTTTLFHANGVAPTDFAVDSAQGVFYESFGNELAAVSLANPSLAVGVHIGAATNIAIGDDGVYWQDGVNIFRSSFDLSTTTLFHANGFAPNDLAIQPAIADVQSGVPEPAAWALMLLGFGVTGAVLRGERRRCIAAR